MSGYKYELHLHTSEVSACARVSAREIPALYADRGYDVIVVTDHYREGFFDPKRYKNWDDAIDAYVRGYYILGNEAIKHGIRVLLGMELTIKGGLDDFLIYGIDEKFLRKHPKLFKKNIKSIYKIAEKNNLFVAQAHPFRKYTKRVVEKYIHGIEVVNGSHMHNSNNNMASRYADEHNLVKIGGSDFHYKKDLARSGIIMNNLAETSEEFAQLLFNNDIIEVIGEE